MADKIRNFYEVGEYKTDAEMNQADAAVAANIEKPDANGRKGRGGRNAAKTTTETVTPPQPADEPESKPEQAATTGRGSRRGSRGKTHDEVVSENQQKMAEYMEKCEEAVDKAADGREEIPFEEASAAVDTVPKPELETPPRRTRKERQAAASAAVCEADTYFYIEADDNYVMKHKGDAIPEGAKEISKEEFNEGVKRLAQQGNFADKFMDIPKEGENSVEGAMNPPESGRRTRRSQTQEQKQPGTCTGSGCCTGCGDTHPQDKKDTLRKE